MLHRSSSLYRIFADRDVVEFLAGLPNVHAILGGASGDWRVRDVADGNLNAVFLVDGPDGGVCVKQALPYVRVAGESWPLDVRRADYEAAYMKRLAPHVRDLAPTLHHYDPELFAIVMETLTPHIILRRGLVAGQRFPKAAKHVAHYVAEAAFHTSDLAVPFERKAADAALFAQNLALQRITVDLVFTDPYVEVWRNKATAPLEAWARALRSDIELKTAVSRLRILYLTNAQSLLHGDLHSGSIMVTPEDTRVIDGEFAWVGPTGFDVGNFLANSVMAWYAKPFHAGTPDELAACRDAIGDDIVGFWLTFRRDFLRVWRASDTAGDALPQACFADPAGRARLETLREAYVEAIFRDAVGFLAVEINRRIIGYAQIADFLAIEDVKARAEAQAGALALARALLKRPGDFPDIAAIVSALPLFEGAGLDPWKAPA